MKLENGKILNERELETVTGGTGSGADPYVWPVPGFRGVVSRFGERTDSGMNNGIDISGAGISGAAVVAAADGTVDSTLFSDGGFGGGYGTSCLISHADGKSTFYAHMTRINVTPGTVVRSGQVIGYIGATGDTDVPKLHFETRIFGICYDPMSEF